MEEVNLTTFDNPFSPFDEFDQWQEFDLHERNYNTNEYLARITQMYENDLDLTEEEAYQLALNEIVRLNVLGIYMKITREEAERLKETRNKHRNS